MIEWHSTFPQANSLLYKNLGTEYWVSLMSDKLLKLVVTLRQTKEPLIKLASEPRSGRQSNHHDWRLKVKTAIGRSAGCARVCAKDPGVSLRSTPRAGSPAEHLRWGARLYANVRSAD
jgi:hypothetical protein